MGFKLLNLCAAALFLCLLKAGSIRGKSCGNLANFFHGRYEVTGNLFGDTAKPVCDKGYMLAGQETTRTCRDEGWDGKDPLCEPVKCSAPPAIENGQLEDEPLDSYDYLQAVSYRCNGGLNLIGQSTLHCSEDGTFKPDPPKCFDGCPAPTIPNAKRIGGKSPPYKLGNFIKYKCEDGYTMKGEAYIVCRANGWDPEPPRCIGKSCGNLANFFHGRYEVTGNLFGDTAKPVCDKGYMLAGQETTRTCRDEGWDGKDPLCEPVKCSAPPAIENGQLEDEPLDSYDYLQAVSYRCNGGLNLIGQSTLHCSEDGTFKPDPPKCFDGCPAPTIPNAKRIGGKSPPYKLGNFIEYKCEDGYTMKGETFIVCRANGWEPEPPRCIGKSCGNLANFFHGRYEVTGNLFGDTAKPVCDKGYMLAGQETTRTCRDEGWDGKDPLCEPVKCSAPPAIENGQLEDEPLDSYDYLQAVSYRCNGGLNLIGQSTLHCSEDGTFKPDPPKCFDGCPAPTIPNAKRIGGKSPPYKLGNFIEYKCEDGYTMKGETFIVCRANGWEPEPPRCIGKSCGNLANFFHGRYEVTGNLFGDTAKPVCDKGYMLAGQETTRTCRDEGWDGKDPLCEPVKCSAPPAIENGQLEDEPLDSYDYLQAVSYRCNGGLNLIGQSTLHCSEDGTFKPDPPKCFDGCPAPTIPNAKRIGGKSPPYKLGNFIEYKCEDGYTMKGETFIVCRANGWEPEPPRCIAPCSFPEFA